MLRELGLQGVMLSARLLARALLLPLALGCGQTEGGGADSEPETRHGVCRGGQRQLGQWQSAFPIQRLRVGSGWLLFNTEAGLHRLDLRDLDDVLLDPLRAHGFTAFEGPSQNYTGFFTTPSGLQAFSREQAAPVEVLAASGLSEVAADAHAAYAIKASPDTFAHFQEWNVDGTTRRLFDAAPLWEVWVDSGKLYWAEGDPEQAQRRVLTGDVQSGDVQVALEYSGWAQMLVDQGSVLLAGHDAIRRYQAAGAPQLLVGELQKDGRELLAAAVKQGDVYWLIGSSCSGSRERAQCARGELWRLTPAGPEKLTEFDGTPLSVVADAECVFWTVRAATAPEAVPVSVLLAWPRD